MAGKSATEVSSTLNSKAGLKRTYEHGIKRGTGKEKLMPKELEAALKKQAKKKGMKGKRKAAFVFGTMNNMGVMHGNKMTEKGMAMEKMGKKSKRKKRRSPSASTKASLAEYGLKKR